MESSTVVIETSLYNDSDARGSTPRSNVFAGYVGPEIERVQVFGPGGGFAACDPFQRRLRTPSACGARPGGHGERRVKTEVRLGLAENGGGGSGPDGGARDGGGGDLRVACAVNEQIGFGEATMPPAVRRCGNSPASSSARTAPRRQREEGAGLRQCEISHCRGEAMASGGRSETLSAFPGRVRARTAEKTARTTRPTKAPGAGGSQN